MNKEGIATLGHLLATLKDSCKLLQEAYNNKDAEKVLAIKKEMIKINEEVKKRL